ncbi:hypothetical protein AURDEDRAFT_129378 [Auricularia subglabra TFB-10046 SS5]|nr:hypothetical protein AURDEDRAFT_129378 [Auricularia subglabra TFB-10046 SS5]
MMRPSSAASADIGDDLAFLRQANPDLRGKLLKFLRGGELDEDIDAPIESRFKDAVEKMKGPARVLLETLEDLDKSRALGDLQGTLLNYAVAAQHAATSRPMPNPPPFELDPYLSMKHFKELFVADTSEGPDPLPNVLHEHQLRLKRRSLILATSHFHRTLFGVKPPPVEVDIDGSDIPECADSLFCHSPY